MFSKKNEKGFTLMEMLIVVAIIAILIAILIPTFNAQLEKSREAADAANIRAAYAEVMVDYLDGTKAAESTVNLQQEQSEWQNTQLETNLENLVGEDGTYDSTNKPTKGGTCTVAVDADGKVSISYAAGA